MEVGKLTVQLRDQAGKGVSRRLRNQGLVPGVCYGAGLENPLPLIVDTKALKASLDPEKRQNTVLEVTVENGGSPTKITAMLWEYQVHPTKQVVTHVDLKAIDPDLSIAAEVPIHLIGKHKGAIDGGILTFERRAVTVWGKPAAIPAYLELDITSLDIGDSLHVSDVSRSEGLELHTSEKLAVVTCVAPKGGVETAATTAEGEAAPEADKAKADKAKAEAKPKAKD